MGDAIMGERCEEDDVAAYIATLLPLQQQAIATAQLAGCRFERRSTERCIQDDSPRVSREGRAYFPTKWIATLEYAVFLPNGDSVGTFEDIWEGALACLNYLNHTHEAPRRADFADGAFALRPDNEQE